MAHEAFAIIVIGTSGADGDVTGITLSHARFLKITMADLAIGVESLDVQLMAKADVGIVPDHLLNGTPGEGGAGKKNECYRKKKCSHNTPFITRSRWLPLG